MARKYQVAAIATLLVFVSASGCQSAPPMSEETFSSAAKLCNLKATTYTFRDGFFLDEPLIDFSSEPNPAEAHDCFNKALEEVDRAATERGEDHISYIWEWRT